MFWFALADDAIYIHGNVGQQFNELEFRIKPKILKRVHVFDFDPEGAKLLKNCFGLRNPFFARNDIINEERYVINDYFEVSIRIF